MNEVLAGNTVRLRAAFSKLIDPPVLADPTGITFKVYDHHKNQIGTTVTSESISKVSTGVYDYYYTVPTGYNEITYEFSGNIEGETITGRKTLKVKWATT